MLNKTQKDLLWIHYMENQLYKNQCEFISSAVCEDFSDTNAQEKCSSTEWWSTLTWCYLWFKYDLEQKYQALHVRPDWCSNSWPPDHDSTFHVTETPALTTRPSVTSNCLMDTTQVRKLHIQNIIKFSLHFNSYSASCDNWFSVGGDGGYRVGEVWAGTISPMPDHKGFKLQ